MPYQSLSVEQGDLQLQTGSEIIQEFQDALMDSTIITIPDEPSDTTGVWLPEYTVYPYKELDEFSFPVSVEYKDELDGSALNRDMRKKKPEVRAVLTASLANKSEDWKDDPFTGPRDRIEYALRFYTKDKRESSAYKWEPTEIFLDLIPKGMMEMNELSPEGREANKSFREMKGDFHGGKIPLFLRDIFRIKKSYQRDDDGQIVFVDDGNKRMVHTETGFPPHNTPLTRVVFKSAMNKEKGEKEVFEMHNLHTYQNPTTGSSSRFVWVPRKITGLLNWVSLRGRGFSNS
jgi:hypothetical protein